MKNNHFKLGINIIFLTWLSYQAFTFSFISAKNAGTSKLMTPKDFVTEQSDLHGEVIALAGRVRKVWAVNILWLRFYQLTDEDSNFGVWVKVQNSDPLPEIGEQLLSIVVVKQAFYSGETPVTKFCTELSRRQLESAHNEFLEPPDRMEELKPGIPI